MHIHDFELHTRWFGEPFDIDIIHQVNTVEKNADRSNTVVRVWSPPSIPIRVNNIIRIRAGVLNGGIGLNHSIGSDVDEFFVLFGTHAVFFVLVALNFARFEDFPAWIWFCSALLILFETITVMN